MNKANIGDQGVKGAVLGLFAYLANQAGMDAQAQAMCMPVLLMVMAWASTKIGDPTTTAIFATKK